VRRRAKYERKNEDKERGGKELREKKEERKVSSPVLLVLFDPDHKLAITV
jgi:hypothetical protein